MQIDRPHVLYNFENGKKSHSKHTSLQDRLSEPVGGRVDDQCLALQQAAIAKMQQRKAETKGVVVPFDQIIGDGNYTVKF